MVEIEDQKENLLSALQGEDVEATPVASLTQTGVVDLMEETGASWPEANKESDLMTNLALGGHELAGFESVRVPWCLTVQAEILGADIDWGKKDQQPSISSHPFADNPKDVEIPDNYTEKGRIPVVLESIENLADEVGDEVAVIGGLAGPATVAGHLVGTENYMKWFLTNPDKVEAVNEVATEACIKYANAMIEAGADIIAPADPVAGPELLSPDMFKDKVKEKHQKFNNELDDVTTVLHICGDSTPILDEMAKCGYDALSIEEKVNLSEAKNLVGDTPIVGTVSTATTILREGPEKVKEEAKENLEAGINVLAPSCGIAPSSPLENLKALVEARDEFYQ